MNDVIFPIGAIMIVFFFHQFPILIIIPSPYTHSCINILICCGTLASSEYDIPFGIIKNM